MLLTPTPLRLLALYRLNAAFPLSGIPGVPGVLSTPLTPSLWICHKGTDLRSCCLLQHGQSCRAIFRGRAFVFLRGRHVPLALLPVTIFPVDGLAAERAVVGGIADGASAEFMLSSL